MRAIARTISVDLSITITAAVPSADFLSRQPSKSMISESAQSLPAGTSGIDDPPGMTASRLSQPPRTPPACVSSKFAQRNAHGLFHVARLLDVTGDAEQLGAGVVRPADAGEPRRRRAAECPARPQSISTLLHGGRTAVEAHIGRKRRLQPRLAFLAFKAFEQRGFLAADVGAGAVVDVKVEIPAVHIVLADQLGLVSLVDRRLQPLALADELAAHVDVAGVAHPSRNRRSGSPRPGDADRAA